MQLLHKAQNHPLLQLRNNFYCSLDCQALDNELHEDLCCDFANYEKNDIERPTRPNYTLKVARSIFFMQPLPAFVYLFFKYSIADQILKNNSYFDDNLMKYIGEYHNFFARMVTEVWAEGLDSN